MARLTGRRRNRGPGHPCPARRRRGRHGGHEGPDGADGGARRVLEASRSVRGAGSPRGGAARPGLASCPPRGGACGSQLGVYRPQGVRRSGLRPCRPGLGRSPLGAGVLGTGDAGGGCGRGLVASVSPRVAGALVPARRRRRGPCRWQSRRAWPVSRTLRALGNGRDHRTGPAHRAARTRRTVRTHDAGHTPEGRRRLGPGVVPLRSPELGWKAGKRHRLGERPGTVRFAPRETLGERADDLPPGTGGTRPSSPPGGTRGQRRRMGR